jgi:biotin operon repressor
VTGSTLELTREPSALETADAALEEPPTSRRELWREIATTDALRTALERALRELADDGASLRATLLEAGVDALGGDYATALEAAAFDATGRWELLRLTRQLGGPTSSWGRSSLEDVLDGPISLLDAGLAGADPGADVPTIACDLRDSGLFDLAAGRRAELLEFLTELTAGLEVRLVVSGRQLRRLALEHGDALPATVTADAQTRGDSAPVDAAAREAADDFGLGASGWDVVEAVLDEPAERATYRELAADPRLDLSRDAVRKAAQRLEDAGDDGRGLLERGPVRADGAHGVRATALSRPALEYREEFGPAGGPATPSSPRCGDTVDAGEKPGDSPGPTSGVTDPPNRPDGAVLTADAHEGDGRPRGEGAAAAAGTPAADPSTSWDRLDAHHAARAAVDAAGADVVLADRPADWDHGRGDRVVSWDDDREELVVRVRYEQSAAATAARLASALTDDRVLNGPLATERLDPEGQALGGLLEDNPIVLRDARCIGWLEDGSNGAALRERLAEARRELLELTGDLRDPDGSLNEDVAGEVARLAHGLAGTVVQLLDLLDVDVTRVLEIPEYLRNYHGHREALLEWLGTAASISSRYGHYSGYRVLHEDRGPKREDLIGTPAVDPDEPRGTHIGSWVLAGPGISRLAPDLEEHLEEPRELQEDGQHYAPFSVDVDVSQAWRREAVAAVASRLGKHKGLEPTRTTISLLTALLGSVRDAARAIYALGGEDSDRELEPRDLRYALAQLPPARLLPDLEATTPGQVLAALLEADDPLPQRELSELAGVSVQSIRDHRDTLEALGLLDVDAGGPGRATTWRATLPTPEDDSPAGQPLHHAAAELLLELDHAADPAAPELLHVPPDDPAAPLELADRWPELRGLLEVVAGLAGVDVGGQLWPPHVEREIPVERWAEGPVDRSTGWGATPPRTQATLSAYRSAVGAD